MMFIALNRQIDKTELDNPSATTQTSSDFDAHLREAQERGADAIRKKQEEIKKQLEENMSHG